MMKIKRQHSTDRLLSGLFALLLAGSVFCVSMQRYDLFETYRKYWTCVVGLTFLSVVSLLRIVRKDRFCLPVESFLEILFIAGALESVYALLQFAGLIPSFNRYYTYTGSFDNPAVFAMLLSFCVPVGLHFAMSAKELGHRVIWILASFSMFVFICFSESRSGILAALVGAIVILICESSQFKTFLLQRRTLVVLIPLLLFALFAAYRFKADSANGRLLIWRVSMEMIKDSPALGLGKGGFLAHYMEYQANYLTSNPESPFILLAAGVNNPFNEYVTLLVNHGIAGFIVFIVIAVAILKSLSANKREGIIMLSLALVLSIWAMFSYPLSIPFVWAVMAMITLVAISGMKLFKASVSWYSLLGISVFGMIFSISRYIPERDWKVVSERSMHGETEKVLPEYERLHGHLSSNANFLYNYGAELHFSGHYGESLNILNECSLQLNDYDVQMLMADDYQQLGDTALAISHYSTAARMVPSKFLPLYYTMKLYDCMGDSTNVVATARTILSKKVKIERSKSVQRIISEAEEILDDYTIIDYDTPKGI